MTAASTHRQDITAVLTHRQDMKAAPVHRQDMKAVPARPRDMDRTADPGRLTEQVQQPVFPVQAVDTTGAGDTFTGYFAAGLVRGDTLRQCMEKAALAAAISVTRPGAASSVPTLAEVEAQQKI